ncbi:MAG: porin [Alphaproteobacteria bacterium]|nr:porin [Alphaproteobacteria bacterium]
MRVQWLSSAALLALIAAPGAFAQQVTSNEPFTIKLSGSSQAALQFVQPSDSVKNAQLQDADGNGLTLDNDAKTPVKDSLNAMQIVNKTRININGDAKVNGIGYGVATTIELSNNGVNNSGLANYIYVAPEGAGKITLGQTPYNADYAGFDGSMTWGTASFVSFGPGYGWGGNATGMAGKTAVMADIIDGSTMDNDSGPKISYNTPSLVGLSAVVAFQPTNTKDGWKGKLSKNADGAGFFNNLVQVGASYTAPDMGGVVLGLAGAYMRGTASTVASVIDKEKSTTLVSIKKYEDMGAYQGRISASGYGLMAQFVYTGEGKSGLEKGGKNSNDVSGMSGSLAYAMGPAQMGVYFGMANLADKSKTTAMGVGASYNVAKGAQVFAGYEAFTVKPDSSNKDAEGKALPEQTAGAVTVGMAVSF